MVDSIALGELALVLEKLRARATVSKDVWIIEKSLDGRSYEDYGISYERSHKLCRLEHTCNFLSALQTTLQGAITLLETDIVPHSRWYGLNSLPDTLLSEIFAYLCADAAERDSFSFQGASKVAELRRDIALVSRRFQYVARTTPSLWAYVNSWDAEPDVARSLKLSRTSPLHLTLQINGNRAEYQEMLALAVPHSRRWQSLYLRHIGTAHWIQIRSMLAGATFPNVSSLRFTACCPTGILEECAFPELQELDVAHLVPPAHVMARLVSLTISHPVGERGRPIEHLLEALVHARNLESLSITLEPWDFLDVVNRSEPSAEPTTATLPALTSISIRALDWARKLDEQLFRSMAWFTRALRTPALSSVSIEVSCFNVGFLHEDLKFFPGHSVLDGIRSVDLRVGLTNYGLRLDDPDEVRAFDEIAQRAKTYLQAVLTRVTNVESLSLQVPGFVTNFNYTELCPKLRSFCLNGSHMIDAH